MEMQQLRYVVAVARTGNFTRAAEQCHVSQPSLSQQVQKLEMELGERLFERLKRTAKPTHYGERFLRRAVRILEEVNAARQEASDAKELSTGMLRVGVLPTIAPYLLPRAIATFTRLYPGLEVVIQEDTTDNLIRLVTAIDVDIALVSDPMHDRRVQVRELFSEELYLALPRGHSLLRKRSVGVSDLENERFILMKEGHCLGDQVLEFCARRDLRANISFRSAQLETIQSMVRAGLGVSMVPAMAIQSNRKDLPEHRSLSHPRPQRKILAIWAAHRAPGIAAEEFLRIVSSQSGERKGGTAARA